MCLGVGAGGAHVILWQRASGTSMNAGPCSVHCFRLCGEEVSLFWPSGVCWHVVGSMWPLERSCWYLHVTFVGPAICLQSEVSVLCCPCFQLRLPPAFPTLLCALWRLQDPGMFHTEKCYFRLSKDISPGTTLSCWWHAGCDTETNVELLHPSNYTRESESLTWEFLELSGGGRD